MLSVSGAISLACLVITGALAALAVFSRHFDDSLLQRLGLSAVAIACILRVPDKLADMPTPPEVLMAQIGLATFGIGTALKLWRAHRARQRRQARQLCPLQPAESARVCGGQRAGDAGLR